MSHESRITGYRREDEAEYCCPGEKIVISRAVHLGRLAEFYCRCRHCRHRDDRALLSARRARQLAECWQRPEPGPLFWEEGAAGVYGNELGPAQSRRMAAALGVWLREELAGAGRPPVAVVAGDGRPMMPELVAAAAEGLRFAGCHVIEIGPATAACTASAIHVTEADGGILIGNPGRGGRTVGLKFWGAGGRPLSAGGPVERIRELFHAGPDRPTRRFGSLRRFPAQDHYLATLAPHFHALRPLRVVVETACPTVLRFLEKLCGRVACRVLPGPVSGAGPNAAIRGPAAHFAVRIEDDGERAALWDERGREVACERWFLLLAGTLLSEQPGRAVVLEQGWLPSVADAVRAMGGCPVWGGAFRARMDQAMRAHRAVLGGGPSGRFWHFVPDGYASADALRTVTLALTILSQSDRPLSEVLDAATARS